MIFDSEKRFPESCVSYVRFQTFALREMFAYLRERESILTKYLDAEEGEEQERERALTALREVQAMLIFQASNLPARDHIRVRKERLR